MAGREVQPRRRRVSKEISTEAIECRTLGHAWAPINPPDPRRGSKAEGHTLASFRCSDVYDENGEFERRGCGAVKHEGWHRRTGEILMRRYIYAEDYGPVSRREWGASELRLELVKRWYNGAR